MAVSGGGSSSGPSLPPPQPKSPPKYPDLYGKRRELAKVQMLEREISFLEEELKFVHGLQPSSGSCKEVADFVVANSDPLITSGRRKIKRSCCFWKWLRGATCFNFSWMCCFGCCNPPHLEMPRCWNCNVRSSFCSCFSCCSIPKCGYCPPRPRSRCLDKISCTGNCCIPRCPPCPDCCSCRCRCSCPNCPRVNLCFCCSKNCFRCTKSCCCYPCYLCF